MAELRAFNVPSMGAEIDKMIEVVKNETNDASALHFLNSKKFMKVKWVFDKWASTPLILKWEET